MTAISHGQSFSIPLLPATSTVPAISLEGFEEATDGRRGNGVYQKVLKALELLRSKKLIYGICPCPMLENPEKLRKMVSSSVAHSTDLQSPESVEHLCSKCDHYAKEWEPVAEELWENSPRKNK